MGPISHATALQRASSPQGHINNPPTDYTLDNTTKVHHLELNSPTSVFPLTGPVHQHRQIKVQGQVHTSEASPDTPPKLKQNKIIPKTSLPVENSSIKISKCYDLHTHHSVFRIFTPTGAAESGGGK